MRTIRTRRAAVVALLTLTCSIPLAARAADDTPAKPGPALNDRERAMIDMLTGAELVGSFSVVGGEQSDKLHKESYTIVDVTKLQDNLFLFRARIRYGDRDVTMPMPLPVIWSGDTPVITLTNAPIPGLGTFSARVLFADGMYAGTWRHGEHAGHLFGEIKRAKPADAGDGAATDGAAK